jgi:hypothetical protein
MNRKILAAFALIIVITFAGVVGWRLGHKNQTPASTQSSPNAPSSPATTKDVKSLVSYSLPDAWKEGTCPNHANKVYLVPDGATLNCDANPSAPVSLSVDPQNSTDCQQLANVQNVRKHTCISLYIDNHKSLNTTTAFTKSSGRTTDETISSYYIDTGKGVVKVDYTYTSNNDYQNIFDQFAKGLKVNG